MSSSNEAWRWLFILFVLYVLSRSAPFCSDLYPVCADGPKIMYFRTVSQSLHMPMVLVK